jgi:hypothetical protein
MTHAGVTGPLEGPPGIIMAGFDLSQVGYTLEEFFLEGTATSFAPAGPVGADGHWQVTPSARAPFATRLVVCRPSRPGAFTGTVVLEWLNVSAGFDAPAYWMLTHRHLVRAGWAWVGVSAQRVGIEGGGDVVSSSAAETGDQSPLMALPALKASDPARYGGLHHPGDAFCFDIFTQAARAVRLGEVLGSLPVECLLASGQSQSAIHLVTYVNAVAPTVPGPSSCDGYLIGSRNGRAAPLTGWDGRIRDEGPDGVRLRTDGRAPVLTVQTETDVTGVLAGVTARQADTGRLRWWEIDPGDPMRLITDDAGIARSGIRTGWVDVPVAALSGLAPEGAPVFAAILGTTRVFDEAELKRRYPGGRSEYAAAFRMATSRAVAEGFVLAEDAEEMVAVAAAGYPGRVP